MLSSSNQKPSSSANPRPKSQVVNEKRAKSSKIVDTKETKLSKQNLINEKRPKSIKTINNEETQSSSSKAKPSQGPNQASQNYKGKAVSKSREHFEQTRRVRNSIVNLFNRYPKNETESKETTHVMRNMNNNSRSSNQVRNHKSAPPTSGSSKEPLSRAKSHESRHTDHISTKHKSQLDPKHQVERVKSRSKNASYSPGKHVSQHQQEQQRNFKKQKPSTESSSLD